MPRVLLTGFDTFGAIPVNPAGKVARSLDGKKINGATVIARIAPGVFFKSIDFVKSAISEVKPDIVIMLGEYGGRSMISVERIANNLNDSTRYGLTDNEGGSMQDRLTVPDGPVGYFTTLPIRAMVKAMRKAGIPADISDTPGTFVCNHLMYGILHYITIADLPIRAGWIHLPHLPSVAAMESNLGAPSMSVETAVTGLSAGIESILNHKEDILDPIASAWQI
ncbi:MULTISPECIES: pyroglutamyl-peptidase I [Gimesia]|uniref:Pyrrolidone-carboxylate peptidase n=1 Tax=Gimesia algae TaxID=2527971 RepID=A0A517VLC1_9PLAN|nr:MULTISPECIES: pyroglutamyl-peptidase I [Gimesia]QDT81715.1 Pyrrolidone-carboxylate peptidase [Gimesia maris]QDT93819.1 Pyrrolidone-carboxylate peptidase [Gimesia algae]